MTALIIEDNADIGANLYDYQGSRGRRRDENEMASYTLPWLSDEPRANDSVSAHAVTKDTLLPRPWQLFLISTRPLFRSGLHV